MKTFTPCAFALSLVAALAVYSIAEAEDKTDKSNTAVTAKAQRCGCCGPGQTVSPLIMALDIDRDGIISELEIKNASSSLKALDRDGNGQLTRQEFHVETKPVEKEVAKVLKYQAGHSERDFVIKMILKYDTNGDKFIDQSEMPQALARISDIADIDGDGKIGYLELFQLDDVLGK